MHYLVVEEGVYTQAEHGVTMEAVQATSSVTARRGNWARETRSYANTYTDPVVVGQVMTFNDADWSVFWASTASSRSTPPSAVSFAAGKHVGEDSDTSLQDLPAVQEVAIQVERDDGEHLLLPLLP